MINYDQLSQDIINYQVFQKYIRENVKIKKIVIQ